MKGQRRGREGTFKCVDRRLIAPELLQDLERLLPDCWARWSADGSAVVFTRVWRGLGEGKITQTVLLSGRAGRVRVVWNNGQDCGALTLRLVAALCPVQGLRWGWICPWTQAWTETLALPDPDMGPADGAA